MKVKELYKRPCFAACDMCGEHGVIVLVNGDHSDHIISIEGGMKIVRSLLASNKISAEDAHRIEDHLLCSDLVTSNIEVILQSILATIDESLQNNPESDCPHPEWN